MSRNISTFCRHFLNNKSEVLAQSIYQITDRGFLIPAKSLNYINHKEQLQIITKNKFHINKYKKQASL